MQKILIISLAVLIISIFCLGQELPIAPDLQIKEWIQGEPVILENLENASLVYVVEFFYTFCNFSQESVSILNRIHHRWGKSGVVVIGITEESPITVKNALEKYRSYDYQQSYQPQKKFPSEIFYRIAVDRNGETYQSYHKIFPMEGVPWVFIIGKNKQILWCGHPFYGLENMIEMIVDGNYHPDTEFLVLSFQEKIFRYCRLIQQKKPIPQREKIEADILQSIPKISQHPEVILTSTKMANYMIAEKENIPFAENLLKEVIKFSHLYKREYCQRKYDAYLLDAFASIAWKKNDLANAVTLQQKAIFRADTPELKDKLNKYKQEYIQKFSNMKPMETQHYSQLIDMIQSYPERLSGKADMKEIEKKILAFLVSIEWKERGLSLEIDKMIRNVLKDKTLLADHWDFLYKLAKICYEIDGGKKPQIINTLALISHQVGYLEEAIELQFKALEYLRIEKNVTLIPEYTQQLQEFQETLNKKNKQSSHTPKKNILPQTPTETESPVSPGLYSDENESDYDYRK